MKDTNIFESTEWAHLKYKGQRGVSIIIIHNSPAPSIFRRLYSACELPHFFFLSVYSGRNPDAKQNANS